jgi:hypothetical protein
MLDTVDGVATILSPRPAFLAAFARRIETSLLGGNPLRNQYAITEKKPDALHFRAVNWLSAFNVGLNDVDLLITDDGRVHYVIRYRRWSCYVLALSAVIGLALIVALVLIDLPNYIAQHPGSSIPSLSIGQNIAIAWAMVLFWGFAWPWILIAMHKRPLRRLMDRLVADVDAASA